MATRMGVKNAARMALAACTAAASVPVSALGLGEIQMRSFLNEPLQAEVELLDTRELTVDDIRIRLAGGEDFDRLGVERSYFLTSIQFEVRVDPGTGRGVIRLSTQEAVLEPYLDLIIEARWPSGRLLREYTVLVDPPAFRQDVVTVSAAERVAAQNPEKPALDEASTAAVAEEQRAQTSGDSVALRESTLPPGEMPERAFSAETSTSPSAGSRYMVRRDETLWQIASQGRPDGISVQQAMLDIQRINPEAFINGNINQIKAGYIIYLPAAGEVSSDDLAAALDEVRDQNAQWQASRGAPGVTTAATLRVSAEPSPREQPATMEEGGPSSSSGMADDRSSQDIAGTEVARSPSEQNTQPPESATDSSAVASSELAAQLDAMAERLDTLEQIVALKDEQIATLEQALREARESAQTAAAAPASVAPSPAPSNTPPPTPPPQRPETGGIPWLPIGGGLLVILLAIAAFLRLRKRGEDEDSSSAAEVEEEDDVFAGVNLKKEALEDADLAIGESPDAEETSPADEDDTLPVGDDTVDPLLDRGGSRGYGERKHDDYIDEAAGGDALAEADIYIAYGRYLQAIELLDDAIKNEPGNSAYRVKLIELYVDMGEEQSAAEQLQELRTHGDADAIARAEGLLGSSTGGSPIATPPEPTPEPISADDSLSLDEPDATELSIAEDDGDSGLELDLSDNFAEPSVEETDDLQPVSLAPEDPLEFKLEDEATAEAAEDLGGAPAAVEAFDDAPIEFDHLEIEEDEVVDPIPGADDLDLSETEEVLDLSDALASDSEESTDGVDGEDLLIADDADQMATKLDLARAYLDMGDSEGARGILEEVAGNGTAEQQQEAQDLLTRIG